MIEEGDSYEPLSTINVTPLVDVLLVLLVIFMITAPLVTESLEIELPKESIEVKNRVSSKYFIISINRTGKIFLNDQQISLSQLTDQAKRWRDSHPNQAAFIRGDHQVTYGKITRVMVSLRQVGISNIGLIVEKKT